MSLNTTIDLTKVVNTLISSVEPHTSVLTTYGTLSTTLGTTVSQTVSTVLATGLIGPAGGETLQKQAAEVLSGGMFVSMLADGTVAKAGPTDKVLASTVLGITQGSATAGASVSVQTVGTVTNPAWTFTPDEPVLLGLNGQPVQTLPVGSVVSRIIGYAVDTTTLVISLQPPISM